MDKVNNYIAALYKGSKKSKLIQHALWALLPFAGCGLGAWALFFGGPAKALIFAHAIIWCHFALGMMGLLAMATVGICRTIINRHPGGSIMSDAILFSNTKTKKIFKIISMIDTPIVAMFAVYANWMVAGVLLTIMYALELAAKNIVATNQAARRAELERIDAGTLMASLMTEEEEFTLRSQIDQIFKKS